MCVCINILHSIPHFLCMTPPYGDWWAECGCNVPQSGAESATLAELDWKPLSTGSVFSPHGSQLPKCTQMPQTFQRLPRMTILCCKHSSDARGQKMINYSNIVLVWCCQMHPSFCVSIFYTVYPFQGASKQLNVLNDSCSYTLVYNGDSFWPISAF